MKVLLIRPPYSRLRGTGQSPYFPLGLGYIVAVLSANGFNAMIYHADNRRLKEEQMIVDPDVGFDFRSAGYYHYLDSIKDNNHYVWKEIRDTLGHYKPDIVGISLLSVEVASAIKVSQLCKLVNDKCYVVWGGVHPTFMPENSLENKDVDFVIRGEGEYAMLDLCEALSTGKRQLSEIDGLSFRNNGQVVHNRARALIENIDELPLPAWESVLYPESFDYRELGSMIISRGCPYRCTFCSSRNFWNKRVRFRSPEGVTNEIAAFKKAYGTNYFMFWDDSLTFNRGIIEKYCKAIIKADLKISWKSATRADLIDKGILKLMKKAGCCKLNIGVESGSDRIKELIHKDVTNDQIKLAFSEINKVGIGSGAFFMAGFPEETVDDLHKTFALMKELKAGEIAFNIFDPMPGSAEYDKCIEFGLVPEHADWNSFPFWPDAHYVKDIGREEFTEYAYTIARWLYNENRGFRNRLRRNKHMLLMLFKNDPVLLLKKIYGFIRRRMGTARLAR